MTEPQQDAETETAVPDLRDVPLGQLGDTPLACSIALHLERLEADEVPLSSFNARI